jgi:hypothetical protein
MEPQIRASLISLLDAIKRSDGATVAEEMGRLDEFLAQGRTAGGLHPQLVHFLEKRSYAKALMFLGGEPPLRQGFAGHAANPPGGCDAKPTKTAKG